MCVYVGTHTGTLFSHQKTEIWAAQVARGLVPPSAQGVILETSDRVPRQAPCMEPASPSAYVSASLSLSLSLCVCVSLMNK